MAFLGRPVTKARNATGDLLDRKQLGRVPRRQGWEVFVIAREPQVGVPEVYRCVPWSLNNGGRSGGRDRHTAPRTVMHNLEKNHDKRSRRTNSVCQAEKGADIRRDRGSGWAKYGVAHGCPIRTGDHVEGGS